MSHTLPHIELAKMKIKVTLLKKNFKHSEETKVKMRKPHKSYKRKLINSSPVVCEPDILDECF